MSRREEYPKELFSLMAAYAKKKSEVSGTNFLLEIKESTPIFYLIGNYDWDLSKDSEYWKEFTLRYEKGEDVVNIAHEMYEKNYKEFSHKWFGCFRYRYVEDKDGNGIVKLHFLNDRANGDGPLASSQISSRLRELKTLFEDVKSNNSNAKFVEGGSWLYNLESYRRLFPSEYIQSMKSISPKPGMLVIWGQFINSEWGINKERENKFMNNLENCKTEDELLNIFEFVELFPKCEIKYFYNFYSKIF
jgi:hypothetical protein